MAKPLVGHHLLRVRIRETIFDQLQDIAEEQTEALGDNITVSDLVRKACVNYIALYNNIKQLSIIADPTDDEDESDFDELDDDDDDDDDDDEEPIRVISLGR